VSAIVVQATVAIPTAIIAEAVLSFLGLGRATARALVGHHAQRRAAVPRAGAVDGVLAGLAIFVLALSFNLAGDGLRDVLDPRDA